MTNLKQLTHEEIKKIIQVHNEWQRNYVRNYCIGIDETPEKKAIFKDASINGYVFENEVLQYIDFSGSDISRSVFINCNLSGSNFKNSRGSGAIFLYCNLMDCNFLNADLTNVVIKNTKLIHVIGDGKIIKNIDIDPYRLSPPYEQYVEYVNVAYTKDEVMMNQLQCNFNRFKHLTDSGIMGTFGNDFLPWWIKNRNIIIEHIENNPAT